LTQLLIGHLLDKVALKTLYRSVIVVQFMALLLANNTEGWMFYLAQLLFMAAIFGAIPFTDVMVFALWTMPCDPGFRGCVWPYRWGPVHWRSG